MIAGRAIAEVLVVVALAGGLYGAGYLHGKRAGAESRDEEVAARILERDNARRDRDTARTERDQQSGALLALAQSTEAHAAALAIRSRNAGWAAAAAARPILEVLDAPTPPQATGEPDCARTDRLLRRYVDAARRVRNPAAAEPAATAAPDPSAVLAEPATGPSAADDGVPGR